MNFASWSVFVAVLVFAPRLAAQPLSSDGSSDSSAAGSSSAESSALPRVQVTAVGALPPATLERALGPALRSSYVLVFSEASEFRPHQLFSARDESASSVHVWVDTTTPRTARLYFANRDGTRYLVRTLELSESIDEIDREALAQTIEWSLQALVEGTAGLTRAEAESLLADDTAPAAEIVLEPPRSTHAWRDGAEGWLTHLALLHGWAPHSTELPATQGPLLRVGVDALTPRHQFGFAVSAQYRYPQRYAERGVALELQSVAARFDARYLATDLIEGSALGVRVGGGFDAVLSAPEALDSTRFDAMEKSANTVPLVTAGFVWQLRVETHVRLELSVGAEIDLVDVRYDVLTSSGAREFVSRWPARPTASLGLELF